MERKAELYERKGGSLSECVSCKHGHGCPYTKEADLFHELIESCCEATGLHRKAMELMDLIEQDIRKRGNVLIGFDVDYHVVNCEKYEEGEEPFPRN